MKLLHFEEENLKYFSRILVENRRNDRKINERGRQAEIFLRSVVNFVRNVS